MIPVEETDQGGNGEERLTFIVITIGHPTDVIGVVIVAREGHGNAESGGVGIAAEVGLEVG